jgi:hypothetical protein
MTDVASTGMSRRAFLTGTGAILGSALLLGPNGLPRPGALARLANTSGPRLSLGYLEGSAGVVAAEAAALIGAAGTRVSPAASLRSGARNLAGRAVTIRLDRLTPGSAFGEAAQLDALIAPPRGAGSEPLPFYAWTQTAGARGGSPVAFTSAVEDEPSLGLSMRVGGAGAWRESVAVLTGGRDRGLPKLRPGMYLIGFDPDVWSTARTLPGAADDPRWGPLSSLAFTVHEA